VTDRDYPALHRASDQASLTAQRTHFRLLRWQLLLFAAAALAGSLAGATGSKAVSLIAALLLVFSLCLTWIGRAKKYEQVWFDCRAIAESSKTATWRYIMGASPFLLSASDVDQLFMTELREIRNARPFAERFLISTGKIGEPDTDTAKQLRESDLEHRKAIYLRERLDDQLQWYTRKSTSNAKSAEQWFWFVIAMQVIALSIAVFQVGYGTLPVNGVAWAMTAAAAFVAWTQAKRFEELVEPYALAAQELSELKSAANHVHTETSFSELVDQVEGTISREHTMWCARRHVRIN
jgi:hypothetical protein